MAASAVVQQQLLASARRSRLAKLRLLLVAAVRNMQQLV
jgi:hypothetical protein